MKPTLEILDQKPPASLEAERNVLGSLLLLQEAKQGIGLTAADFHDDAHAKVFRAIDSLAAERIPPAMELVVDRLKTLGHWESTGSLLLAKISDSVANAAHLDHFAKIVKAKSVQRRARQLGEQLIRHAQNGESPDALLTLITNEAATIKGTSDALQYERITSAELDQGEYKIEYLVDGILVAGQPCILAGPKKALKTSLLVDLGVSLALGGCFLGKFKVNRAVKVALMSGESGLATLRETAKRVCKAARCKLSSLDNLIWSTDLPQFDSGKHLDALERFLIADAIEVLAVDPTYMAMGGGDAGNLFIQGGLLRGVSEVCQRCGVTLVLVHHTRKGGKADPFAPPELEHISWSGFQEFARQWILVDRRERYEPGTGEHALWLSVGGSAGHSSIWGVNVSEGEYSPTTPREWTVEVLRLSEVCDDADRQRTQKKEADHTRRLGNDKAAIRRAFQRYPQGETRNILRQATGLHADRFGLALDDLESGGEVVTCEITKANRKQPYPGFRLNNNPQ